MAYIVIGLSPPGLFLMRELVKTGEKVYAVGKSGDIGLYSKYGEKFTANCVHELKHVVMKILELCDHRGENPKVFLACSDFLDLILREWEESFRLFNIVGPSLDLMRILNRKTDAYALFSPYGIKHPCFCYFDDYCAIDSFPVILKWNSNLHCAHQMENVIGKTNIINNHGELLNVVRRVEKLDKNVLDSLIFQQFMSQDVKEFSYGAYWHAGEEKMNIITEQVRQYPMGISSYAIEIRCGALDISKKRINSALQALDYTGFIQMDLLKTNYSDDVYLLDVNPRAWGHMKILAKKYGNFHQCVTKPQVVGEIVTETSRWVDIHRDVIAVLKKQRKSFSPKTFLRDIRGILNGDTVVNTFELSDPKPFFWGVPKVALSKMVHRK